jgi:hypothetical protein
LPLAIGPLEVNVVEASGPVRSPPAQSVTFQHAEMAFRRAALIYALGGGVHAATSVLLLFLLGFYSVPSIHVSKGFLPGLPAKNIVAFQAGRIFACYTGAQISGKRLISLTRRSSADPKVILLVRFK